MDHNKDGRVEFDEFVEYMVTHGFTSRAATDGPAQIVDSVFDILDADGSGSISAAELRTMMTSFSGSHEHDGEAVQLEHLHDMDVAMQMFDLDGSGLITRAELRKAVEMMHTFAASKKERIYF